MKDANVQISPVDDSRAPEDEDKASVRVACSQELRTLHIAGSPLVLFSAWDAGSAQALTESGAKAIAIDAWSVAAAHGYDEVEHMPVDLYFGYLQTVIASSHLPVTAELSGFCSTGSGKISDTVTRALRAGASGVTIGDVVFGCGALRDITDQAAMISAARAAGDAIGVHPFLYARSDVFYLTWPDQHSESMVALAVERSHAFADAGADSLFVPGLSDLRLIDRLVRQSPLPVSVMIRERSPSIQELSRSGVACVASGPLPYRTAMSVIRDEVRAVLMLSSQMQLNRPQDRCR